MDCCCHADAGLSVMTEDDEDGPACDAVSCAYCDAIFDAQGQPFNANGEHVCPVCAGSSRAYRPRYVEMACWPPLADDE